MDRLDDEQVRRELGLLEGWTLEDRCLTRTCRFPTYRATIAFVNQVADVAEQLNHHPDLLVRYGSVGIRLTTHDAGGLTQADFDTARAIDALP